MTDGTPPHPRPGTTADPAAPTAPPRISRRRALGLAAGGAAVVAVAGVLAVDLVDKGVLPGKGTLDALDGACDVAAAPVHIRTPGPETSGSFFSRYRRRQVGYTIGFPPDHRTGDPLPLVVMLHGFGGNHTDAITGMSPAQAVALDIDGRPLAPMAIVTSDGGGGYWNPHPGDDPMGMVIDELIPMCRHLNLGGAPSGIGMMGISMGGFGAFAIAEHYPALVDAVAAISPAVWTTYGEAVGANAGAFASAADFDRYDVVTHASGLGRIPVRMASGADDPFHPGVQALAAALPPGSEVVITEGCHTDAYFASQIPPSMAFLSSHLAAG